MGCGLESCRPLLETNPRAGHTMLTSHNYVTIEIMGADLW